MNFPVRQANFGIFECFAPSHYVFVNAVNRRAIENEENWWDALSGCRLGDYTDTAVILCARAKPAVTAVLHSSTAKCLRGRLLYPCFLPEQNVSIPRLRYFSGMGTPMVLTAG